MCVRDMHFHGAQPALGALSLIDGHVFCCYWRCIRLASALPPDGSLIPAVIVLLLSSNSHTGYVCMVFYLRDSHVVELQAGDAAPAPEEACTPHYFNPVPGHYTTLIGKRSCYNIF